MEHYRAEEHGGMSYQEYYSQPQRERQKKKSGKDGESAIYRLCKSSLNIKGYYKIVQNIPIRHSASMGDVDMVLIHEKGIFVFESKNWQYATIYGEADNPVWTAYGWSRHGSTRGVRKFGNPIGQNATHCRRLSKFLDVEMRFFTSVIAFSNDCHLNCRQQNIQSLILTKRQDMTNQIKSALEGRERMFLPEQVDGFYQRLKTAVL